MSDTAEITTMSQQEIDTLVSLLNRLKYPVSPAIFYALCANTVITCAELAVIRRTSNGNEVLLVRRESNDPFFKNLWSIPGSVIVPGNTTEITLANVMKNELGSLLSGTPELVQIRDIMKGTAAHQCPRGQEVMRLFLIEVTELENLLLNENRQFFPLNGIPNDFVSHQSGHLDAVRAHFLSW